MTLPVMDYKATLNLPKTAFPMKANLPKIKDSATKQQMQLDTELWDAMVSHLEGMQKMMSEHGMGGMHHGPHGPNPPEPPAGR